MLSYDLGAFIIQYFVALLSENERKVKIQSDFPVFSVHQRYHISSDYFRKVGLYNQTQIFMSIFERVQMKYQSGGIMVR